MTKYVSDLIEAQRAVTKLAQENQQAKDEAHLEAPRSGEDITFEVGEYVLLTYPSGPPNKFKTNLKGPLQVEKRNGDHYDLRDLRSGKSITIHVSRMSKYNHNTDSKVSPR